MKAIIYLRDCVRTFEIDELRVHMNEECVSILHRDVSIDDAYKVIDWGNHIDVFIY